MQLSKGEIERVKMVKRRGTDNVVDNHCMLGVAIVYQCSVHYFVILPCQEAIVPYQMVNMLELDWNISQVYFLERH